jgi:hypothetical protein
MVRHEGQVMSAERDYRAEAERLAQLPKADQEAVVAMYQHLAGNPVATPACRLEAKAKALALKRLLGLRPSRIPGKASGKRKTGKTSAKPARKR